MHSTLQKPTKIESAIEALCVAPWLLTAIATSSWLARTSTSATATPRTDAWIEGVLSLVVFAFGSD